MILKENGNITSYEITDLFIWKSSDTNSKDYGVLVGYTRNIMQHTTLTIPDRCTKIHLDTDLSRYMDNIREIKLPRTITEIGQYAFTNYGWYDNYLNKITYAGTVEEWKKIAFESDIISAPLDLVCSDRTVLLAKNGNVLDYDITDLFIWKSSDPTNKDYGVLVGYTSNIQNHTTLTIPDRCTKIDTSDELLNMTTRSFTSNIKVIELPRTIT